MKILSKALGCCVVLVIIIGCSKQLQPVGKIGDLSRKDFMKALRWKQYQEAANFMLPEYQDDFVATFSELRDDLHISDVRLIKSNFLQEGHRVETTMEMDYFLLPSVVVKTFTFEQVWLYHQGNDDKSGKFLIITSFPQFP